MLYPGLQWLASQGAVMNFGPQSFFPGISCRTDRRLASKLDQERGDALFTILKVKGLANEVGGLKKLKVLVEALSEEQVNGR